MERDWPSDMNPYIRRAGYDLLLSPIHVRKRVIYDYELLYIKDGKTIITIEG